MGNLEDANEKAAATYNAAADSYDHPANFFWERYDRRTVERLRLPLGARVLDVCCGSGASAIPAADTVGPGGSVFGVDLAENLLELGRDKAKQHGLENIVFRRGDMLDLRLPDSSFDAVINVFGIFFVPDMQAAVRELWRRVRAGGKLAITTWGPRFFEPASTAFWDAIRVVRPDLYKGFNPWDRISDVDAVRSLLMTAGVEDVEVVAEAGSHPLSSPEDWWAMVLGSGYRGTVEQLAPPDRDRVRVKNLEFIQRNDVRAVEANVVYAVAVKPKVESEWQRKSKW
jgi:ubiquinone/menaquinone biosynthesis C-methylase UbiE